MNIVLQRKEDLRDRNYILHPDRNNSYWSNMTLARVNEYSARCGEAFNIVLVGAAADEGDFYAIPYSVLKPALAEQFLFTGKTSQVRWIVSIRNHQFEVRKC